MGSLDVKYPWPSAVNVASFVTVKPCLDDDEKSKNFNIWKQQMLCLLEGQNVLGFVDGETPPPEKDDATVETEQKLMWRRTDKLVKGWILGSIGKDALDAVWELETAREVWLELEKKFDEDDSSSDDDDSSTDSDGDLGRYLPLYKAALKGDWETANTLFFEKDKEVATAIINYRSETALHAAVSTGKANDFVKKLVELMPNDALALKNWNGDTALHVAAMVGNKEAAITLVGKNPELLHILNDDDRLPVREAAIYCQRETLEYLISCMSKPNAARGSFEGQLGVTLLIAVVASEFFDIALDLVDKYPNLARLRKDSGISGLSAIADMSSVFPSGESFCWWQKLIYNRIPLEQPDCKAPQATSVAGDIENVSCDAPANSSFQIISGGKCLSSIVQSTKKLEFMLWKVIEYLVPRVKSIRHKKEMHQQAIKLVKRLCHEMASLPESKAKVMFKNSIIKAAKYGISEIVEEIMEVYPMATFRVDGDTGRNVFLLAASYRFENVFNLIYNLSDRKYLFVDCEDNEENNLMHICGTLAPPDRLNLVPGAALQMQRELHWFKEMEKFVSPPWRIWSNNDHKTPKMIFTEEHRQLKADGERWMKDTANACTIAAALIATVVFASAFTVPGGITDKGIPIFFDKPAFILFAISDAISLFTSVTSLLMFLSILTSRYAEEDFLYVLPKRLSIGLLSLFISITFMLAAFSATLYLVFQRQVAWFLIPVAAIACLPVTSFVLLQFPLLLEVIYSTYGPGIFGKKSDRQLY